jgi:hypothetical protein
MKNSKNWNLGPNDPSVGLFGHEKKKEFITRLSIRWTAW